VICFVRLLTLISVDFEDAEGELLRRVRSLVGPDVPILVTLDLHGNITQRMVDNCSCLIAVRTYPHIDYYDRAWQAAKVERI
jgi:microcystin degradation protein MlrC